MLGVYSHVIVWVVGYFASLFFKPPLVDSTLVINRSTMRRMLRISWRLCRQTANGKPERNADGLNFGVQKIRVNQCMYPCRSVYVSVQIRVKPLRLVSWCNMVEVSHRFTQINTQIFKADGTGHKPQKKADTIRLWQSAKPAYYSQNLTRFSASSSNIGHRSHNPSLRIPGFWYFSQRLSRFSSVFVLESHNFSSLHALRPLSRR